MASAKKPATKPTKKATTSKKSVDTKKTTTKPHATIAHEHVSRLTGRGAGFVNFVREQGVIGLAVGLAIGTAAGDTVKKLVEGFISPIVQFVVGSQKGLETASWHIELWGRSADFKWGAFVSSFITLAATALVIYLIVHFMKLDRLDRKKDK